MDKNVISKLIAVIAVDFLGGFLCYIAWNGWAWEFNLPQFSYLHWVATFCAIRFLQKSKGE